MTPVLRVGLNLLFHGPEAGGVGRAALELLAALAARDDIAIEAFVARDAPSDLLAAARDAGVRVHRLPASASGGRARLPIEYGMLPARALARGLEVLHSPANAGPVRVPRLPCVVSVHDVIWRRAGDAWGAAEAQRAMERTVVPIARRADIVVTGSENAAADLVAELGVARERIAVVPHGVRVDAGAPAIDEATLRARYALGDGPVLLCIAQKRVYKNQAAVVRAFAAAAPPTASLVLPGAPTPYEDELRATAAALGVADRVRFPDWVGDDELEGLYRLATALVLPSRIEGFGLPVLEAMARGVPVVCSRTTALGEVAGDAALLVDPDDDAEIAGAMRRVLGDARLREELADAGRRRAAEYTWSATADGTVAAYRRAIARRR